MATIIPELQFSDFLGKGSVPNTVYASPFQELHKMIEGTPFRARLASISPLGQPRRVAKEVAEVYLGVRGYFPCYPLQQSALWGYSDLHQLFS